MAVRTMESPLGRIVLRSSAGLLTAVGFDAAQPDSADEPVLIEAERQIAEYFAGDRREFDLPSANDGKEFQQKVWRSIRRIAYGTTKTYGQIAAELGYDLTVSRAVGAAAGANRLLIVVPCHRVVAADGNLAGYAGGVERKQQLLELENPGLF